jgi:hypothetical protein
MASDKKARQKSAVSNLPPRDLLVAEAVLDGKNMKQAAEIAGCTPATARNVVKRSYDVQAYLEDHRKELRNAAQIERGDVITGFMDAIDLARTAADPGSMIRGWSEIGKMLGLYAPEKKEVTITAGQRNASKSTAGGSAVAG